MDNEFLSRIGDQINIYREFPLPVLICSADWRVQWSNELAGRFYEHLAVGENLELLLSEFSADRLDEILKEALKTGNCTIKDIFPMSEIHLSISPILDGGRLIGLTLIFLRAENMVAAKDYYQSSYTADAIANGIREYVSNVSSVLDLAGSSESVAGDERIKSGFDQLRYDNYHFLRTAANITEYVKGQSGIGSLRFETVNLADLLSQAAEAVRPFALRLGIPVEFRLARGDFIVSMDPSTFQTAFFNILHNSLYYTRAGNRVQVTLTRRKKSAVLRVADSGLGIPAKILPDVTKPYVSHSPGRISHCLGLGLTVARMIVIAHDGDLHIRSAEGKGTVVTVTLPEDTSIGRVQLTQGEPDYYMADRFSAANIALMDAMESPYNPQGSQD